jgi:hypothetical protein
MKTNYDYHYEEWGNSSEEEEEEDEYEMAIAMSLSMEREEVEEKPISPNDDKKHKERMRVMETFRKERSFDIISHQNSHYNRLNGSLLLVERLILKRILSFVTIEVLLILYKSSKTVKSLIDDILTNYPLKSIHISEWSSFFRFLTSGNNSGLIKTILKGHESMRFKVKCDTENGPFCQNNHGVYGRNIQAFNNLFKGRESETIHIYHFSITSINEMRCLEPIILLLANNVNIIINIYYTPYILVWPHELEYNMQVLQEYFSKLYYLFGEWNVHYDKRGVRFNQLDNFTV